MSLLQKILDVKKHGFDIQFIDQPSHHAVYVGLTTWADNNGEKRIVDASFMVDSKCLSHATIGPDAYMALEIDRHLKSVYVFFEKEGVTNTSPPK